MSFSVKDTNFAKGFAICMVLFHHLFNSFHFYGTISFNVAIISRYAVASFFLLSGYGLSESVKLKPIGLWKFYFVRFSSIYLPYWFVWMIFVPIGVFYFKIPLRSTYGTDVLPRLIENLFGVQIFFGFWGYNPTWWFISVILGLYLIFPLLVWLSRRFGGVFFVCILGLLFVPAKSKYWWFTINMIPFVLGMYASRWNLFEKTSAVMKERRWLKFIAYVIVFLLLVWQRQTGFFKPMSPYESSAIDGIIAFVTVMVGYEFLGQKEPIYAAGNFVGRHSFNIFLFHTFIFQLWFRDAIYSFKSPPVIFLVLLVICLAISVALENVKRIVKYDTLIARVRKMNLPDIQFC